MHASHEALTLHSPVAHPGSPWLTLLARCECLKRHGVGEWEGELGADFTSIVFPIPRHLTPQSGSSLCKFANISKFTKAIVIVNVVMTVRVRTVVNVRIAGTWYGIILRGCQGAS
jgi:hypothetical protein